MLTCLAMMIWSTLSTVMTASVASFTAHHLVAYRSMMPSVPRSFGAPVSMSTPVLTCRQDQVNANTIRHTHMLHGIVTHL